MTRTYLAQTLVTAASLVVFAGCGKQNQSTDNPDEYDGYTDETPGGEGDDTAAAGDGADPGAKVPGGGGVAKSSSTRGSGVRKIGKHRSLVATKPAVTGGDKPNKPAPKRIKKGEPPVITGVVPSIIVEGGVFAVYGDGFDEDNLANNKILIGNKGMKILEHRGDHLVVEATGTGTGKVKAAKGKLGGFGRRAAGGVLTQNTVQIVPAGDGFAVPAKTPGHGLLATLYDVGAESTEMPDFNSIGDPVGYMMFDNLNMESSNFAGVGPIKENFGMHFQGSLNIVEGGEYELCLTAGDGALLFVAETPLLDVEGAGEAREVCDTLEIEPGEYDLQLLYFQNNADLALKLTWAKDGGAKEPIPAAAFFPPMNLDGLAAALNQ